MKSLQEELLKTLSDGLGGTDYVFEPDEYKKGTAVREPADLVWACNNCIVLMYMYQRKYKIRTPEAHAQMRRDMYKHNLKQAKGWLSEWKSGRPLTGRNARQTFRIGYDDYQHVIVLSVIDCNDEEGTFHFEETKQFGVVACATVPQQALTEIGKVGGAILEIVSLVGEIATASKRGDVFINAVSIVKKLHLQAIQSVDSNMKWLRPTEIEGVAMHIIRKLMRLRAPHPRALEEPHSAYQITDVRGAISGDELKIWGLGAILNDMPLIDFYSIAYVIRDGIAHIVPKYDKWFLLELITLSFYRVGIVLSPTAELAKNDATCVGSFYEAVKQDVDCRGALFTTWIIDPEPNDTYSTYPLDVNVLPNQHNKKSPYTEEVLKQLRNVIEA